jgi:dolichyldiphosphatase
MFAGQMACEALNWVLKRHFKEERPRGRSPPLDSHENGQTQRRHANKLRNARQGLRHAFLTRPVRGLLLRHPVTVPVVPSRPSPYRDAYPVHLCRTPRAVAARYRLCSCCCRQVLVGCACGAVFALVWFGLTTYLRRAGWIEWALSTWVARAFRVRDLVVQEDLVDSGWARWEERRKRQDFRLQGKKSS